MSTSQWVDSQLTFKTEDEMQSAVQPLRDGGWLAESNQMFFDEGDSFAGDGIRCISGLTLTIPSEIYLNIGRAIYDVVEKAESGFFHSNCDDGDLWIECWKDGKWVRANDYEEIAAYIEDEKSKDLIILDEDEFADKYGVDEDYIWENRSKVFEEATLNMINQR
jgi:hypothetical protein